MEGNTTNQFLNVNSQNAFLPYAIIYVLIVSSGIVGNSFVLFMYLVKMRRSQIETRFFIPILAVFDLILCLFAATFVIMNYVPSTGPINNVRCKTVYFFLAFAMITSNALLLTIAIQRYLKVCRPLGKQMTLFWRRFATAIIILTSIIYATPHLLISGLRTINIEYNEINISIVYCDTANGQYPTFQLSYYLFLLGIGTANLLITVGMYIPIMCAIYRHFHSRSIDPIAIDGDYTMVIQDRNPDAKQKFQTAKTDMSKVRETGLGKDGRNRLQEMWENIKHPDRKANQPSKQLQKKSRTPTTNFNMMFFFIILIYVIAYVPTMIIIILLSQEQLNIFSSDLAWLRFLVGFYVINHAANPFVYAYFDMQMRKKVVGIFRRKNRQS